MIYRYETHMHTAPVSRCASASVEESLRFYRALNYDGVFVTNHFLDGNINIDRDTPYEEKIRFYFSDYEAAAELGPALGIRVFCGVELSYGGTDFLIYGLDKAWYLAHPEIMDMPKSQELPMMMESGALVVQAHPYREAGYIDHIRLYPRSVQGVEVYNAERRELENRMAARYAEAYGLLRLAGSDNHIADRATHLGGMAFDTPLRDERDFIDRILGGQGQCFAAERDGNGAFAFRNL